MAATAVAVTFIRHRGAVVLLRRGGTGADSDRWATVSGYVEADPERATRRAIREQTGTTPEETTLVRTGDQFTTEEPASDEQLVVHPFLFDSQTREIETTCETSSFEWVPPTALLDRETALELWRAYDRVRPTVASIEADTDHGSTWLSVRALEVLRDEAGLLASDRACEYDDTATVARALLDARPAMTVVGNRVNRAMSDAGELSTQAVENAAHDSIERALRADSRTAEATATEVAGKHVATLSRSGTVLQALESKPPDTVLVAESRPGGEGVDVAETLAAETSVTLTTDTGFADQFRRRDVDLLVVGADAVLADGRVVNKVGTRSAAIVATHENSTVLVATASDKIRPDSGQSATVDLEPRDESELYEGNAEMTIASDTFDVTPADCIDAVVTERGRLGTEEIDAVAGEHARLTEWE